MKQLTIVPLSCWANICTISEFNISGMCYVQVPYSGITSVESARKELMAERAIS